MIKLFKNIFFVRKRDYTTTYKVISILTLFITILGINETHSQNKNPVDFDTSSENKTCTIIADDAVLQLVSDQFSFTEGPAVDKKGNVYFTDQPNNRIWKYSIDEELSIFLENAGRSNGMYFDQKENLITCADEQNQLWSISQDKKIQILLTDFKGLKFNGPNDLWIDNNGGIYFTDPYYQRNYWTRTSPEILGQKVYYKPKEKTSFVVADSLLQPNGIIGTADNKFLYVADIKDNKTYRFDINPNGTLTNQKLFVSVGSDGMTIDSEGNIYLTGNGVSVFNSEGTMIEHIEIPEKWTANVTFGGKERNILFITASKSVYTLKMKVSGIK